MHRLASEVHACRRGEIWMVDFDPAVGHEQRKVRPALVLSADWQRVTHAEMVTVVPITSHGRTDIPTRVPIAPPEGGLVLPGHVMGEQVRTISTQRLRRLMGIASGATVERVAGVVRGMLGL